MSAALRPSFRVRLSAFLLALSACAAPALPSAQPPVIASAPKPPPTLEGLHEGDVVHGFTARAVYVDDDDRVRGARLVHVRTGFVFDYLAIESVPQAFVYATTYPTGDGGEPHTQEHLILGKGNMGVQLGNVRHSSFSEMSAFTAQHRTAYHFNTSAGEGTFWKLVQSHFDALLHPDYTDDDIRREVRNFGVAKQPDGTLALDEKGTVYNEMVRTSELPGEQTWNAMARLVYGDGHPLAGVSGGTPEGIRALTPEAIHAFHATRYQLGNMGMVGSFPLSVPFDSAVAHVGEVLDAFASKGPPKTRPLTEAALPPAHGAAPGTMRVVEYPYATADHPSPAMLTWPATRKLDPNERTVMELFLGAFAGGRGSTLYKALVDHTTRKLDLGATGVWEWTANDPGEPVYIGADNLAAAHADEASLTALRDLVRAELANIAALPDGSTELAAFGDRVKARAVERRRRIDKKLDTPPEFGTRGTEDSWIETLDDLARVPGFRKPLTYRAPVERAVKLAGSTKNEWHDLIRSWGLLEIPYAVVARPSPTMRARLDQARAGRVAAELARLEVTYGTHDAQEALRKREAEIAHEAEVVAKAAASVPLAPLAPDPPMTIDDSLQWTTETRDGVTRLDATFETMKGATVGVQSNLDSVPEESLPWLGVLPPLIKEVGVVRDGVSIPYDEVEDRLRREVLGVDVHFSTNTATARTELAFEASGNDAAETSRALAWTRDFLSSPDWRPENLARVRDVVGETFTKLHDTMSSAEENWVEDTEEAYRRQDRTVLRHTHGFLTRVHDAFVVSWRLEGGDDAKGVAPFLKSLATAGKKLDRASLVKLAEALAATEATPKIDPKIAPWVRAGRALPKEAQARARKAGHDLGALLSDIPDGSLAADWAALCGEMAQGVSRSPREGLAELAKTLASIRHVGNARVWTVGSSKTRAAIRADVDRTLASLDKSPPARVDHATKLFALDRARARGATGDAAFAALLNPSLGNSSLVHTAPAIGVDEKRDVALVDYLAANVFNGEGTQSFYKRIWGAALAYSGYVYTSPRDQQQELYSDRCADLSQLLRFVDAEVRAAPSDARFVDYAIVPAFWSRASDTFETRARAMATDLHDGFTPEKIRAFRERLLALRKRPGLADEMRARYLPAMGAVIPSLLGTSPVPEGAVYFTVGPEPQIAAYEREIERTRGDGVKVVRLWPRDFWDVSAER